MHVSCLSLACQTCCGPGRLTIPAFVRLCRLDQFKQRVGQLHQDCAADVLVDSFALLAGNVAAHNVEECSFDAARLVQVLGAVEPITDEEAQDMISGVYASTHVACHEKKRSFTNTTVWLQGKTQRSFYLEPCDQSHKAKARARWNNNCPHTHTRSARFSNMG